MSSPPRWLPAAAALLVAVAGLAVAGPAPASAGGGGDADARTPGTSTPAADLVVGGDGVYDTIGGALEAAGDGDVVVVRPGTYEEAVTLADDVVLRAPDGATLDGSGLGDDAAAVTVPRGTDAAPTVAGFTVVGYGVGVRAVDTRGDWVVRDLTFRGFAASGPESAMAVDATDSAGDWRVANSTFVDNDHAVAATGATGDWTVTRTAFRDNGYGVYASHTDGDWRVENSTFTGHRDGVQAWYASGEWVVANSTFRGNREGVYTSHSDGQWVVANSTFRNNSYNGVDASGAGGDWLVRDSVFRNNEFAIDAVGAAGRWRVRGNVFVSSTRSAVYAIGAEYEGDATRNWWGNRSGQDVDDCWGNVDCTDHLTAVPPGQPALYERPDTEAWNATPVMTIDVSEAENDTADPAARGGNADGPEVGALVGAAIILLLGVGALVGPILYVRRYGLV
jgi:nitrous oxidase accessory protein NosD